MHLLCCQPLLLRLGSIVYIGIASMMTESGNVYRLSLTNLGMLILSITNFESYTGSSAVRLEKSRHNICKGSREARLWQVGKCHAEYVANHDLVSLFGISALQHQNATSSHLRSNTQTARSLCLRLSPSQSRQTCYITTARTLMPQFRLRKLNAQGLRNIRHQQTISLQSLVAET